MEIAGSKVMINTFVFCFSFFYKHCQPGNFVGLDIDFFNLYFARNYFAKSNTILICCDIDIRLLIKEKTIDNFYKEINILSNVNFWKQLIKSGNIRLDKEENISNFYSIILSLQKEKFFGFYYFYQRLLKNTKVDFYQDAYLKNE